MPPRPVTDEERRRNEVVEANLPLAFRIGHRRRAGRLDVDERISAALEALVDAAIAHDPAGGEPFGRYAARSIRRAIARAAWRERTGPLRLARRIARARPPTAPPPGPGGDDGDDRVDRLRRAVDRLPDRERRVVRGRFGLDGTRGRTADELAWDLRCGRDLVGRIQAAALARLRDELGGDRG